jgi:hypothetical protein
MSARTVFSLDVERPKNVLKNSPSGRKIEHAYALYRPSAKFLPIAQAGFSRPTKEYYSYQNYLTPSPKRELRLEAK